MSRTDTSTSSDLFSPCSLPRSRTVFQPREESRRKFWRAFSHTHLSRYFLFRMAQSKPVPVTPRARLSDLLPPLLFPLLVIATMPRASAFTYSPLHPKSYVSRVPAAIESTVRVASTATATPDLPPEALIPAPLNPVQRLRRAATFWSQVVPILGNYALIQRKLAAAKEKGDPVSPEEEVKLWEDAHNWGAERLASTIQTLKGFYVKVCPQSSHACIHVYPVP